MTGDRLDTRDNHYRVTKTKRNKDSSGSHASASYSAEFPRKESEYPRTQGLPPERRRLNPNPLRVKQEYVPTSARSSTPYTSTTSYPSSTSTLPNQISNHYQISIAQDNSIRSDIRNYIPITIPVLSSNEIQQVFSLQDRKICHQTKIESVEEYINESSLSRQRLNPPSEDKQREMKFRKEFRELVDRIHPHGRPKNQDGDTYTDGQLEEIAQAIRARLRRVNTCHGGMVDQFLQFCQKIVEIYEQGDCSHQAEEISKLQNESCLRINDNTQDGRIQVPRWTEIGGTWKEKKVYIYREIYVLFNLFDTRRQETDEMDYLKHNQLHQKYCHSENDVKSGQNESWLCANPLHYARVCEETVFNTKLKALVTAANPSVTIAPNWEKTFMRWARDLRRNFSCGPDSCADDFLERVKARIGHRAADPKMSGFLNMVYNIKNLSLANESTVIGPCCLLKKTCQTPKVTSIQKGLIDFVRPELRSSGNAKMDEPKWICADKKSTKCNCVNPDHCKSYTPNQSITPKQSMIYKPTACKSVTQFDKWCVIYFIRFAKDATVKKEQRTANVHDSFTGHYPVTKENILAAKRLPNEKSDDQTNNEIIFSKININPYSIQDHPGENKCLKKATNKKKAEDEFIANANFNLVRKRFDDEKRCVDLDKYDNDKSHAICLKPERQRRMCSHSYYEGFEKTWSTKVTKKVGFDVSMRLTDEMIHKMTEMDNSEPEFSIFVTNTGKRDIYTSIPFLKRYLIHNELLEHQIPRDQIEFLAENNVYEKVSPGQSIRMIDVSSKTAQTLQYITKETSILKDCGTDYLSNFTILCDWHYSNDSNEASLLKFKQKKIESSDVTMVYELETDLLELEYFVVNSLKTYYFVEGITSKSTINSI